MSALVAQRSRLEAEAPDLVLEDVESGRNPGRPQYQQLRRLIEAGNVREVVAASFSRLGRDATESDAFVALCDRHRVVCRTLDDGVLTMATPVPTVVPDWAMVLPAVLPVAVAACVLLLTSSDEPTVTPATSVTEEAVFVADTSVKVFV